MDKALTRDIVEKGVKSLLEEAEVPLHMHLRVVRELHDRIAKHDKDNAMHERIILEQAKLLQESHDRAQKHSLETQQEIERIRSTVIHGKDGVGIPGKPGKPGKDGKSVSVDEVVKAVLPLIPRGKKVEETKEGEKGNETDPINMTEIVNLVLASLKKEPILDMSHIKGATDFVMRTSQKNVKIKFEELMHGAGSTSGGSSTPLTPTGTVDSVNTTFGVTSQPSSVIADGITYFEGHGYSYATLSITMDNPPSQYIRYYA